MKTLGPPGRPQRGCPGAVVVRARGWTLPRIWPDVGHPRVPSVEHLPPGGALTRPAAETTVHTYNEYTCTICMYDAQHGESMVRRTRRRMCHAYGWHTVVAAGPSPYAPMETSVARPTCRGRVHVIAMPHYMNDAVTTQTNYRTGEEVPNLVFGPAAPRTPPQCRRQQRRRDRRGCCLAQSSDIYI